MTIYKWQALYQAAVAEFNADKLKEKSASAEFAICARFQELARDSNRDDERLQLNDAVTTLRALQTERLGYPIVAKQ